MKIMDEALKRLANAVSLVVLLHDLPKGTITFCYTIDDSGTAVDVKAKFLNPNYQESDSDLEKE